MKRKTSLLLTALSITCLVKAQHLTGEKHSFQVTDYWQYDPSKAVKSFEIKIQHLEAPFPGGEAYKKTIAYQKSESAKQFPRAHSPHNAARGSGDTMEVSSSFALTNYSTGSVMLGGTPNDNTLAISNGGMLLSSYNSRLWGKDINEDTLLFDAPSFHQFMDFYSDTSFTLSGPFDPKLLYDKSRDRFIFTFLTGRAPSNSGAIVAFSSTNNPTDVWHVYRLSGNPLSDSTWTDYPQLAITENELFYSLNQLYPDSSWITGFAQTVIWQINLDDAFAGNTPLNVDLWSGINYNGSKLRYLHPVKNSIGTVSDEMYFVGNRPFDIQNDSIFLVKISGEINSSPTIEAKVMKSNLTYGLPPDALQPDSHFLLTNDARVLGAVRIGEKIQFVGTTIDPATGQSSIYHGTINDIGATNPSVTANYITHSDWDLGYPNIEFMGNAVSEDKTVIFFNHTSATEYPGNSATFYENGNYSPIQRLIKGTSIIDKMSGPDRWGDYTGIQRKYDEFGKVWVSGYYSVYEYPASWVTELIVPGEAAGISMQTAPFQARVFPNPLQDRASVEFYAPNGTMVEIVLYDLQGRKIHTLARDRVKAGRNEFSFSTAPLSKGAFILSITGPGIELKEKIIRE